MYRVTVINGVNETIIHDVSAAKESPKIISGEITQGINTIDSFSFRILSNNPGFERLYSYATLVNVYNTKKAREEFCGRVLIPSDIMDSNGRIYKDITCESRLAYLCDSIQPYTDFTNYTVSGLLSLLLTNHNAIVDDYKKIYLGTVTVTDPNDNLYRNLNYQTTWAAIQDKLIDSLGGEIQIREANGLLYLDYLTAIGSTKATSIELAVNMKSIGRDIDPTDFATRIIPLGAKIKDAEDKETEERLTIASVNDGKIYLDDLPAQGTLGGVITKIAEWNDITLPANLKAAGQQWLIDNNTLKESNDIEALDLSLIGLAVDDFMIGNHHPVKNRLLNIDNTLRIIKKTINVVDPPKGKLQFGDSATLLTDWQIQKNKDQNLKTDNIASEVLTINGELVQIRSDMTAQATAILQDAQSIILEALEDYVSTGDYGTYQETVTTQFEVIAGQITMNFNTLLEASNYAETNFAEINKYIRFDDGDIILGESGNELTLTIQNDRIAFSQNGVEVAYLSNNKLYVTDGEFIHSLQLGNFAFVPRSNGNLSLKKVGG